MVPQNVQQFPSGEVRIYRVVDGEQVLHAFIRAPGDKRTAKMTGKTMAEMNAVPVYEAPANVEPIG